MLPWRVTGKTCHFKPKGWILAGVLLFAKYLFSISSRPVWTFIIVHLWIILYQGGGADLDVVLC